MLINEVRERFSFLTNCQCQVAAIAMAARLLPGYETFSKKYECSNHLEYLTEALTMAQTWIGLAEIPPDTISALMRKVENVIPNPSDYDDDIASFGLDSASAVYLAIFSFSDTPLSCLNDISTLSTDSADRIIQRIMKIDHFDAASEQVILSHPAMAREICAQSSLIDIINSEKNIVEAMTICRVFLEKNKGATALVE